MTPGGPHSRVLVVSIDGVAPRFVTPAVMPRLGALAVSGASCYRARTVIPSITVPAHASMLRGVDPQVHGLMDNDARLAIDRASLWPSFLGAARAAGLGTAALLNWAPLDALVEPDALDVRWFLDGGYGDDDSTLAAAAPGVFATEPDVAFAYLVAPDNAGHAHGWGSPQYMAALGSADGELGRILDAWGPDGSVIVTTDHGGHGDDHCASTELDLETFVVARSPRIAPGSMWPEASVLDVAPTVAELAGFEAPAAWSGTSLIGREESIVDHLWGLVATMADHTYGELVTMADHSHQAATLAAAAGATDEMVVAALLHDVGHLMGQAGEWGLPDHAEYGARYLQGWLPAAVVEPIRLHVAAKRYLVGSDPAYRDNLSRASIETLAQQGGPYDATQAAVFAATDWSQEAVALRRLDDDAKVPGLDPGEIEGFRQRLARLVADPNPSATWLRDACVCDECRHPNGQHLIDVTDLDRWRVVGRRGNSAYELVGPRGEIHHVVLDASPGACKTPAPGMPSAAILVPHDGTGDLAGFIEELDRTGLALATGLGSGPGTVLEFAARVGFVRSTNYGELFDVAAKPDPKNLAYTNYGLPLHTDNPYRDPVPTVQLLHCLVPAGVGGASVFADGLAAARALRTENPHAFETLATTALRFHFRDAQVELSATRPMIETDLAGEPVAVAVNHRSMVTPDPGPGTDAFYRAYRRFVDLVAEARFCVEVALGAGDLVAFDNRRILHARTGFGSTEHRHLQGCYIDIDAIRSTARMGRTTSAGATG